MLTKCHCLGWKFQTYLRWGVVVGLALFSLFHFGCSTKERVPRAAINGRLVFSPDGSTLAAVGFFEYTGKEPMGRVWLWSTKNWEQKGSWEKPFHAMVYSGAFSNDGTIFAASTNQPAIRPTIPVTDFQIKLIEVKDGHLIDQIDKMPSLVTEISFVKGQQHLIGIDGKGFPKTWVMPACKPSDILPEATTKDPGWFFSLSPDGRRIVIGTPDKMGLRVWDLKEKREMFSWNGKRIIGEVVCSAGPAIAACNGDGSECHSDKRNP